MLRFAYSLMLKSKNMKRLLLIITLAATSVCLSAQSVLEQFRTVPEKSGGVYYAYPGPQDEALTAPPQGYLPFYISHYGRHGSRYMLSDNDYLKLTKMLNQADSAGVLTPLGKEKMAQMQEIWAEANGHTDELAPLGKRQHRGIAERMFANFPEVFANDANLSARSTTSLRCCLSMVAFCERLKELNPSLKIDWNTSKSDMIYLNYHGEVFENAKTGPDGWLKKLGELNMQAQKRYQVTPMRFGSQIISDTTFLQNKMFGYRLMQAFYDVASDLQDMETPISFFDLFTPEELYSCWVGGNIWFYTGDANSPHNNGAAIESCQNLVNNIIEGADKAIAGDGESATLRFGHDGNIIPLAASLHLDGCDVSEADAGKMCELWQNYNVSPRAANIPRIFYRKDGSDDIIVRFLLNEHEKTIPVKTDIAPFYHWKDVRAFLKE